MHPKTFTPTDPYTRRPDTKPRPKPLTVTPAYTCSYGNTHLYGYPNSNCYHCTHSGRV